MTVVCPVKLLCGTFLFFIFFIWLVKDLLRHHRRRLRSVVVLLIGFPLFHRQEGGIMEQYSHFEKSVWTGPQRVMKGVGERNKKHFKILPTTVTDRFSSWLFNNEDNNAHVPTKRRSFVVFSNRTYKLWVWITIRHSRLLRDKVLEGFLPTCFGRRPMNSSLWRLLNVVSGCKETIATTRPLIPVCC